MAQTTLEDVTRLADQLPLAEKQRLIEHLVREVQAAGEAALTEGADLQAEKPPQSLYGIWEGHFPEDFDIDAVLYEIRHEWEQELDEVSEE